MEIYRDHHATIFIPAEIAAPVENLRQIWDEAMAKQIAAHITLCYPQETPRVDLLIERLRETIPKITSFRLRLGKPAFFENPEKGIYVEVFDIDGGIASMRNEILQPPFAPVFYVPHLTIIHPRTSKRGREFWENSDSKLPELEFTVEAVALTVFDVAKWATVENFARCVVNRILPKQVQSKSAMEL